MIGPPDTAGAPPLSDGVSLDTWRGLYELAGKIRALEPWKWMEETDVFGVEDPANGETVFVSVMGLLGEYHAIAVYPDAKALAQFWQAQDSPDREGVADLLSGIHYVHAAFGGKGELRPEERRLIETLGLTFKGANRWPCFRSYRPGWFPWTVDAREARWLALAMEQLLDVAPRVQKDRRLLGTGGPGHRYLVRTCLGTEPPAAWRDTHKACAPPATSVRVSVPSSLFDAVRAMVPSGMTIELDVFPSYTAVGKRGERPQSPYMLLAVEATSGFILGVELLSVEGVVEDIWAQTPAKSLELLKRNQMRPARLELRTPWVAMVMGGLCKDLGIEMNLVPRLPALAQARRSLDRFNRR